MRKGLTTTFLSRARFEFEFEFEVEFEFGSSAGFGNPVGIV